MKCKPDNGKTPTSNLVEFAAKRWIWLILVTLLSTSCSVVPVTSRVTANSVGKGKIRLEAKASPAIAVTGIYGVTDDVDIGLDAEQGDMLSVWSQYSLLNDRSGTSLAATAGVFAQNNFNNSRGYYVGSLVSHPLHDRLALTAGYRFSRAFYDPVDMNREHITEEEIWGSVHSTNSSDLSKTSQVHFSLGIRLPSKFVVSLGVYCQHQHSNRDPERRTDACMPLVGLSSYSW